MRGFSNVASSVTCPTKRSDKLRLLVRENSLRPLNFFQKEDVKIMENDRRNHKISFRMNDEEYEIFMDKFLKSKSDSQGKFIRRMLLNGIILHFDESKAKTAFRLISNIANNINQIALRVNSTGNIYAEDISEIQRDINELWRQQRYFQSELQKLRQ